MDVIKGIMSLKIVNAKLWLDTGTYEGGLVTENGAVSKIGKESSLPQTEVTIDAEGKLVIPGLVDLHVHFREPGFTQKEDFSTGTRAAAAGGVTTVLDEPNNNPVTSSTAALRAKKVLVKEKAYVDYLFEMAVYAEGLDEVQAASSMGIKTFAFFDELVGTSTGMDDTGVLFEALKRVKKVDGLALLNCRESDLVIATMRKTREKGSGNLMDYNNHFPHVAESAGGAKRILLAHNVGARAHFREVSTAETVEMLRLLKPYRGDISAEVRPDHLVLNHENTSDLGPYAQQWTPIRTRQNQEALWGALNDGTVNILASDHATHTVEEKNSGWGNIWESPPGLPAIESMLPILLTAVNEGKTSLERVISATTANPARRLGLYPRKGCIAVGSDADLVVIDTKKERKITADEMYAKSKWTPYEGWTTLGAVEATILRGVPVYQQGEIVSEELGRFIFG